MLCDSQIAELLLQHGANPLLKDNNGKTAFGTNREPSLQELMVKNIPKDSSSAGPGNTTEEISGLKSAIGFLEYCFVQCPKLKERLVLICVFLIVNKLHENTKTMC